VLDAILAMNFVLTSSALWLFFLIRLLDAAADDLSQAPGQYDMRWYTVAAAFCVAAICATLLVVLAPIALAVRPFIWLWRWLTGGAR